MAQVLRMLQLTPEMAGSMQRQQRPYHAPKVLEESPWWIAGEGEELCGDETDEGQVGENGAVLC